MKPIVKRALRKIATDIYDSPTRAVPPIYEVNKSELPRIAGSDFYTPDHNTSEPEWKKFGRTVLKSGKDTINDWVDSFRSNPNNYVNPEFAEEYLIPGHKGKWPISPDDALAIFGGDYALMSANPSLTRAEIDRARNDWQSGKHPAAGFLDNLYSEISPEGSRESLERFTKGRDYREVVSDFLRSFRKNSK